MLRRPLAVLIALLAAACSPPGPEDRVARYVREAPSGPVLVKAAANGDARVEAGETVFLRKSGTGYVVLRDAQGRFTVRRDDLLAELAEADRSQAPFPRAQPRYETTPGGAETIAGIRGTIWRLHPAEVPSLTSADAVIADAPRLANLGKALQMQARFAIERNSAPIGGPGNFEQAMIALFERGAVLRLGKALRLERIQAVPIAPGEFDPPAPILDRTALRRRLAARPARAV